MVHLTRFFLNGGQGCGVEKKSGKKDEEEKKWQRAAAKGRAGALQLYKPVPFFFCNFDYFCVRSVLL